MQYTKIIKRKLPVSLKLARAHLRLGDARHDDALVEAKIEMAIGIAEDFTGRIIRQSYVEFDVLLGVGDESVSLPIHTSDVVGVSCLGTAIPDDEYVHLAGEYGHQLMLLNSKYEGKKLSVQAVVGYSRETIPPAIQAAILLLLGTLYDNESDNLVGRSVSSLSITAEKLLAPWRVTPYGDV